MTATKVLQCHQMMAMLRVGGAVSSNYRDPSVGPNNQEVSGDLHQHHVFQRCGIVRVHLPCVVVCVILHIDFPTHYFFLLANFFLESQPDGGINGDLIDV